MAGYDLAKIEQLVRDLKDACDNTSKDMQEYYRNEVLFQPKYRELWLHAERTATNRLEYWALFADHCENDVRDRVLELSEAMHGRDFRRDILVQLTREYDLEPEYLSKYDRVLLGFDADQ